MSTSPAVSEPRQRPTYVVYLAGPEVFLPEALQAGREKKERLVERSRASAWPFRLEGLYPLDTELADFQNDRATALSIYRGNVRLIEQADAVLANMVRFRGPSMDVGTAFEMGLARGLGKPVFGYYDAAPFYGAPEAPAEYAARVAAFYGTPAHAARDPHGHQIESFGLVDNLMLVGALDDTGYDVATSFDEAIDDIARHFLGA